MLPPPIEPATTSDAPRGAGAPAAALLELRGVTQVFGTRERPFTAIQDVAFSIHDGELVCLLGPSGCGKSTLLRIAAGLQRPSQGTVLWRGEPLTGVNLHTAIVFQSFALFPWLTVQQNVEVALQARGLGAAERRARATAVLDRVGLDGFEGAYPRELSGGMRQKAGFARAIAVQPELLCLDEPFSALDVLSAEGLRGELLELWSTRSVPTRSILMVTHDIQEAAELADRIVVMDKGPGRILAELPVQLPHPRARRSPAFTALVDRVYALLAGKTQPEHLELGPAPGGATHPRMLPQVTFHAVAALLEHLVDRPGEREDMFRLAEELHLGSEHLLRLTEGGELLGLLTVGDGDAQALPLGVEFARADIPRRKQIFAARARRLPLIGWLLDLLRAAEDRTLPRSVVEAALELEWPAAEARRQVHTILQWGRLAELVGYDARTERIRLEPAGLGGAGSDTAQASSIRLRPRE